MFAKKLLQKAIHHHQHQRQNQNQSSPQPDMQARVLTSNDLDLGITLHYGIPLTASILAFDPIQRLLAIGTLDGRIKIIGGGNIEGLLISPKKMPYKILEFLCNQGFVVGISNDNDIQVWDLEYRSFKFSLQWEVSITAFSIIKGTSLMYVGDELGSISVLKYAVEEEKLVQLPYHITLATISEATGVSLPTQPSVVGILPQPSTYGNRVLIAYDNGVMVLWDVSEDRVVTLRGHLNLHLEGDNVANSSSDHNEQQGNPSDYEQEEKEICSLCWASSSGSLVAVGYTDGDILLWDVSSNTFSKDQHDRKLSNDVVKLQLSSGGRRLPVIVLHWSPNIKSDKDVGGQLFIYGGDEIGSDEVLTVLSLEWSPKGGSLHCIDRMDLTLNGSFADMLLIPKSGISESSLTDAVFVLTNPGQLHVYEGCILSTLKVQEEISSFTPENFPTAVPTIDPCMTAAKHYLIPMEGNYLKALLEKNSSRRNGAERVLPGGTNWPVTGGVPSLLSFAEDTVFERIYVAGYQDGSVRIWDATNPILTLMYVLEGEVQCIETTVGSSSISALDFCSTTLALAVGCESGLVRIYKIHDSSKESMLHFLSETKHEVDVVSHEGNVHCTAVINVVNSPVQTVQFMYSGSRLAVGYKSCQVMVLDMNSMSVLFNFSYLSGTNSVPIYFTTKVIPYTSTSSSDPSSPKIPKDSAEEQETLLILTHDAHIAVVDSITGNMISPSPMHPKKECTAISMHMIEISTQENSEILPKEFSLENELDMGSQPSESKAGIEKHASLVTSSVAGTLSNSLLLLCCEDSLRLYPLKSVIQGDNNYICKVDLVKPCCWSTTFKLKQKNVYGVILLYQTGLLEIRTLPELEVVEESSLMSMLRWPFKMGMDKTLSSSDNGEISMVYGCELAFVSIFPFENVSRTPESLPSLHDKVLAAAATAAADAVNLSIIHKKRQGSSSKVFGSIIKGFKGGKIEQSVSVNETLSESSFTQQLEKHFSRMPLLDTSVTIPIEDGELSIDDIEIDEPLPIVPTSSQSEKHIWKDEKKERQKLFEGAAADAKPKIRSHEEIITKYKFGGDASAAAAHARDKLIERQEKLQRINEKTEELRNNAEDFESMAKELAKAMKNRKFWQL